MSFMLMGCKEGEEPRAMLQKSKRPNFIFAKYLRNLYVYINM